MEPADTPWPHLAHADAGLHGDPPAGLVHAEDLVHQRQAHHARPVKGEAVGRERGAHGPQALPRRVRRPDQRLQLRKALRLVEARRVHLVRARPVDQVGLRRRRRRCAAAEQRARVGGARRGCQRGGGEGVAPRGGGRLLRRRRRRGLQDDPPCLGCPGGRSLAARAEGTACPPCTTTARVSGESLKTPNARPPPGSTHSILPPPQLLRPGPAHAQPGQPPGTGLRRSAPIAAYGPLPATECLC